MTRTHTRYGVAWYVALFGTITAANTVFAQDTRTVTEPVVPAECATVRAAVVPVGDRTVQPADDATNDAPRIQQAIDTCSAGRAVRLSRDGARRAFVTGPLQLRPGVTLVLDSGVILFASRNPRHYDVTPGACGILSSGARGCRPLILAERANGSGVMGPGTIDGRGWAPIDAAGTTWWELAERARDTEFSQQSPRLIQTLRSNNFTLYRITLKNAPNFHVVFDRGDGFTAWGVVINTPRGARNSDGIDPASATNVSILHSFIHTGDDNVAIKGGNSGPTRNITVAHSHFYNGHGVSVGSETNGGVSAIRVFDVTFDGTDNALRIKSNGSRGGLVQDVKYDDACIRNVKAPIYMDSHYSASPELDGTLIPVFRDIVVRNVRIMGRGTVTLDGYDRARALGITFNGVWADDPTLVTVRGANAALQLAGDGSNLRIPTEQVDVQSTASTMPLSEPLRGCERRLVPFPGGAAPAVAVPRPARFLNPILAADFSDPDVIRDGNNFWMTASSFGHVPGLPILHSNDLVHWQIVNYAIARFPDPAFDVPQHGNGVWAPSLRKHDGWFWIFFGDPDRGIFMTRTRDPRRAWSPPVLVQAGKGLIDPTPFWDDDGRAYLVHAYARSRSGIKHKLVVRRMSPDGRALLDSGTLVFEDSLRHPTAEGPKFYKRDGWYWIFAPAGGVATGWQLSLRARSPLGPYEARTVLAQGTTPVNGPHQGAWVSLANGDDWFVHFQDRGAYGRVVHLQPMRWRPDGWPVIGLSAATDTTGMPVRTAAVPRVAPSNAVVPTLQMSDEFTAPRLGLQWQWQANPRAGWFAVDPSAGVLRLTAQPLAMPAKNLWDAPNLLLQKFPAEVFTATTKFSVANARVGDVFGVIVFGLDYAWLGLRRVASGWELVSAQQQNADRGGADSVRPLGTLDAAALEVQLRVSAGATVRFAYRQGGGPFRELPATFIAREGKWVGAKFGVFATTNSAANTQTRAPAGTMFIDYVRVSPTRASQSSGPDE